MSPKAARVNANYTVKDMAKALGMQEATYRRKENGESKFYFSEAMDFLRLLSLSIDDVDFLRAERSNCSNE